MANQLHASRLPGSGRARFESASRLVHEPALSQRAGSLESVRARGRAGPLDARHRGSIILMTLVMVVLLVLAGAAYMQMARVQRASDMDAVSGDIDAVLDAILTDISQTLNDDMLDGNGVFFNAGAGPVDADGQNTGFDEPYDYPWTNNAVQARRTPLYLNGGVYNAAGGQFDDPWLAASTPVLDTNNDGVVDGSDSPYWLQISDVYGNWVFSDPGTPSANLAFPLTDWRDVSIGDADRDGNANTNDQTPNSQDWDDNGYLPVNSAYLVDADGDGVGDSRWAWPSVPSINGVLYVTAIRIVDASSMLNPDVALGLTDAAGAYDDFEDAPRWLYPTDLDLNNFASGFDPANGYSDARNLYGYRLGALLPPASPGVMLTDRIDNWTFAASRYTPSFGPATVTAGGHRSLAWTDEYDLRLNGGIGDGQQRMASGPATSLEQLWPNLLDDTATPATVDANNPAAVATHFGINPANVNLHDNANPRNLLSIASGASIRTTLLDLGNHDLLKLPLQPWRDTNASDTVDIDDLPWAAIRTRVSDVYSSGTPAPAFPTGIPDAATLAHQFEASLRDYLDADNRLSASGGRYGLEALPALGEVYVQRVYETTASGPGTTAGFNVTWAEAGATGYAIEIRNPFSKPISLENVQLWIKDAAGTEVHLTGDDTGTGPVEDNLDDWVGTAVATHNTATYGLLVGDPRMRRLFPGDVIVLYKESTSTPTNGGTSPTGADTFTVENAGDEAPLLFDPAAVISTALVADWIDDASTTGTQPTGGPVRVELRAKQQDNAAYFTWAYNAAESVSPVGGFTQTDTDTDHFGTLEVEYLQHTALGNGAGVNTLLYGPTEYVPVVSPPGGTVASPNAGAPGYENIDAINLADKTAVGGPADKVDANANQFVISDRGRAYHVGELAHLALIGPSTTQTVGEVWGPLPVGAGNDSVADFMLDPYTATPFTAAGNGMLPHAAVLMDQFIGRSPQADAVDNDGDGTTDEADERFVPGMINLNTAPRAVLDLSLPIADPALRTAVVNQITAWRGRTPARPAGTRTAAGFAFTGELLPVLNLVPAAGLATAPNTFDDLVLPTNPALGTLADGDPIPGTQIDFLSNVTLDPLDVAGAVRPRVSSAQPDLILGNDDITNDREERAMVAAWIMQNMSVRSDAYIAYILVEGYDASDTARGPIERARAIAVFNRTGSTSMNDDTLVKLWRIE